TRTRPGAENSVAFVGFVGRRERVPSVTPIGLVDQLGKMQPALESFIVNEAQRGHGVDVEQFEQQGVEPPGFLVQDRSCHGRFGSDDGEIDLRVRVVGRQVDAGERDQPGPRHVDLALDDAGQILLDLVGKPDVPACVLSRLVSSHDAGSEGACDFADLEDFELIAHLDIVVATQGDTAAETGTDFLDVLLEAATALQHARPDDHVVAQQAHLGIATHDSIGDHATGNLADARDAVDLADFDHADDFLALFGRQHAGQGVANIVHRVVDDVVVTQVDAVVLGQFLGTLFGAHVEADDYRIGGDGQVDVAFRDATHSGVHELLTTFVGGELDQGLHQLFLRALHVGLDDERQRLLAFAHVLEHGFQLGSLLARQLDVAILALTEQRDFA